MPQITIKRIYDSPSEDDGVRILVDRLWPRGLTKEQAALDIWARDLAPSTELRKWFHGHPDEWDRFEARYREELKAQADGLRQLRKDCASRATLLYSVKDPDRNHAVILKNVLESL